jgi:hypothetical protein
VWSDIDTAYSGGPLTISVPASANFRATIDERAQTITYRLSCTALDGAVIQSHIHFGGRKQSGGIIVFLCSYVDVHGTLFPGCEIRGDIVT